MQTSQPWPGLGGEMAGRVREFDWAATPLGPIETWSESLRTVVGLVLATPIVASVALFDERLLIYNDAAARLYGDRHPAALGRPLGYTFPDSFASVAALYDRVFAGESLQVHAQPLSVGEIDGGEVFDAYLTPVRKADGSVIGAQMIGLEIGERVRAEAALAASESRYRAFVTASEDVVYRMSADWSEMRELDGRGFLADTRETRADWMEEYIHPDDRQTVRARIDQAIQSKTMFDLEHRVVRDDGTLGWTHSRAVPIIDRSGELVEWLGAASDVTARHDAEEALRESEAMRDVALAGGRMGTWRWNLTARTVSGDAQFLALWGIAPSDRPIPLSRFTDRQSVEGNAQTEAIVKKAIAADDEFDSEVEVASGPTAGRWIRWRGRAAADDSSVLYGVSFDITEQKRAQERLRESEGRLQVLVAELQHRVRNILAIIRAIMRRSLDSQQSLHDYAQHLEGRFAAMARTQVLLTRQVGVDVDLEDLIRDELVAQTADEYRIDIAGPAVGLSPKAAEVLTLAIHELATNSLKYGAIGNPAARLSIEWQLSERDGTPWLTLGWIETGVSIAALAPRRVGFGTELIQDRVPYELKGHGILEIQPGGLVCTIEFPLIDGASVLDTGDTVSAPGGLS